jgi:DNA-directed RNA polymerase specialized sigma24 family protein
MTTARGSGVPDQVADERARLQRAQRRDRAAFDELYERHAPAAWRLALVVGRDDSLAVGAVVDATARVLGTSDRRDPERFDPVEVQLLTAARHAAMDAEHLPAVARRLDEALPHLAATGTRVQPTDETVDAFARLPELWRSVLWLRVVERLPEAQVAAVVGVTEQSAIELVARARAGLHEQLAQRQVLADLPSCQRTANRLSDYATGSLADRDTARVRRHLATCEGCRRRLDDLDDLPIHLHRSIPALPLVVYGLAEQAWLLRTSQGSGPLGLHLPNGRPAPAWAERALASTAAGLVALGVTAAIAFGARDAADPVEREAAASDLPFGDDDGEVALAGELPGEAGTDGLTSTNQPAPAGDVPAGPASPTAPGPAAPAPASTSAPRGVTPDPSSSPTTTPPTTVPPAAPSTGVVEVVDDVLEPLDLCTGVGLVDGLAGCDVATDAPALPLPRLGG